MGNSNSHTFDNHDWQFVSKPSTYDIVQDKRTGLHAEKHVVLNNPTIDPNDEMEVYHYRNLTDKPIVKVYNAEYGKSQGGCGAAKDIVVHSQYIPHRLSDVKNLNHGQALYVMSQALAGFHELHHRFGPFQITDDHIGFNQIGQARVWHSPNFATNHLDRESIVLMSTANPKNFDERMERRQQQQMVEDIWMAVDQHANISKQFTDRAHSFREMNFSDARRLVAEQIGRDVTYVPDYLNFEGMRGTASNQSNTYQPTTTSVIQNTINQPQIQSSQAQRIQGLTYQNSNYSQSQPQNVTYQTTTTQYVPQHTYQTEGSHYQSYYSQNSPQPKQYQTYQVSNSNVNSPNFRTSNLGTQPQIVTYGQ